MEESKRIDKWLWEVRVFKTRNQATIACRAGKLRIDDQVVKPSRELQSGILVTYHQAPIIRTFHVLDFPAGRVGAKLVPAYMLELTPAEEFLKLKMIKETNFEYRERGIGRPTKRQRRDLEQLKKKWKE